MLDLEALGPARLRAITRAEYERMIDAGVIDEGEHIELIRGGIVEVSPQGTFHRESIQRLTYKLLPALIGRAVVMVQMPLALSDDSEPEPDLAVVPLGDYAHAHPSTALLVIEVARDSLENDRRVKAKLYAEAGVPEYWIVDVRARVIEVHRSPTAGVYADVRVLDAAATLAPQSFPDVSLVVGDVIPT